MKLPTNMETVIKKQTPAIRLVNPDLLKLTAIFFVVFIHGSSIFPYVRSTFVDIASPFARICVPLFILLWSFFMKKGIDKSRSEGDYIKHKFNKLLLPFFFWSFVYFFILADFTNTNLIKFFTKHFTGRGWSGQYYFIILFQLVLLFYLLERSILFIIKFLPLFLLLSISFYVFVAYSSFYTIRIVDKVGDEFFLYWIPYVIVGILLTYKDVSDKFHVPLWVGIISLALIPIEFYLLNPLSKPYLTPTVFVASTLLFTSVMNHKSLTAFNHPHTRSFLAYISNNTLGIFCINPLIVLCLAPFTEKNSTIISFWGCSVIMPILSTAFIIVLCLIVSMLLKRIRLGFLVSN